MHWSEKYMHLPFVSKGRDWKGVDCWGLVALILKERCGLDVPQYLICTSERLTMVRTFKREIASGIWLEIEQGKEQVYDVAVMKAPTVCGNGTRMLEGHAGLIVKPGVILHTEETAGMLCQVYDERDVSSSSRILRNRLAGFFRFKQEQS